MSHYTGLKLSNITASEDPRVWKIVADIMITILIAIESFFLFSKAQCRLAGCTALFRTLPWVCCSVRPVIIHHNLVSLRFRYRYSF